MLQPLYQVVSELLLLAILVAQVVMSVRCVVCLSVSVSEPNNLRPLIFCNLVHHDPVYAKFEGQDQRS